VSKRLEEILQRKQALIARCARDRDELAASCGRIRLPFDLGGTLLGFTKTLRAHPIIAAGVSALLVSGYAGKLTRSLAELLRLWKLAQPLWFWWTKRRSRA
jgi:hypothetical protein